MPSPPHPPDVPRSVSADDDALVDALLRGDERAFEELVRTRGPRLLAVATRYLPRRDDAEDAVQDAFVAVVRGLGGFQRTAGLDTWMHRIVVNAALMILRRRRRKPELSIGDGSLDEAAPPPWKARRPDGGPSALDAAERDGIVREELAALPDGDRALLLLRDVDGFTLDDIAELLDCGLTTVKSRLQQARVRLEVRLAPRLHEVTR